MSPPQEGSLVPQKQLYFCARGMQVSGCSREPLQEPEGMIQNERLYDCLKREDSGMEGGKFRVRKAWFSSHTVEWGLEKFRSK